MENRNQKSYRISRLSGELTYDNRNADLGARRKGDLSAEKGAMLDEAGYPFGRALSFTSPTGQDERTHDEVVGGGHTIEVQDETINQIGRFQHRGKLADFGKSDPYRSENATASEPMRDNFGVAIEAASAEAGMSASADRRIGLPPTAEQHVKGSENSESAVRGAAGRSANADKRIGLPPTAEQHVKGSENSESAVRGAAGTFNERIVPTASNSVYGNSDLDRAVYGDFEAGMSASADKRIGLPHRSASADRHIALPRDAENDVCASGGAMEADNSADLKGIAKPISSDCPPAGGAMEDSNLDAEKEDEKEKEKDADEKDKAVVVKSGEKLIKTIVIAGQIEGHTQLPQGQKATRYEELIPQLVEIEESDEIGGLLLILNTVGGDVEAGLALSEMIAGMKKPTASLVLGGGHSIGVPLAVSAKRSFIVPSATMTLHPVRVTGMVLSAPQTYVYLNNMQERIIDFTCSHCKIGRDRFYELMLAREEMSTDLGSVLDGKKAVEEGLIDALGTLADAISFLKNSAKS